MQTETLLLVQISWYHSVQQGFWLWFQPY